MKDEEGSVRVTLRLYALLLQFQARSRGTDAVLHERSLL